MKKLIFNLLILLITGFSSMYGQCVNEKGYNDFPFTENGITVTKTLTGNFSTYTSSYSACGITEKAYSIWTGQSGPATFQTDFSIPMNDISYNLAGANTTEAFTVTVSHGTPTISFVVCDCPAAWTISGNVLTCTNDAFAGGNAGGRIKIHSTEPYTWIKFSHNGGAGGTIFTMCFDAAFESVMPTVTTATVTSITSNSATSGGNITEDGGSPVIGRGVCWNTTGSPTVADSKTSDGTDLGTFTSSITGLTAGVTYYVRAYATNTIGTGYGSVVTFTTTTTSVPTISTTTVSSITTTSASSGGNITNDGNQPVTARGVCWNTSGIPTISNSRTTDGSGTGTFSSSLTGLTPGTLYYVRAYATNSIGTGYGNQITFATPPTDPTSVTASSSSIYIGSSTELTANGAQGTVYWYTGSCGGTEAGTGNPLTVSPTATTIYYARNSANSVFSDGCASVNITVNKYDQTITFDPISEKIYGVVDLTPASASSGLAVTYTSSNTAVSTIVDNKVHIVGVGSTDITASQAGNSTFNPASDVTQTLTVSKAPLTVTADNKDKNYGAANPELTVSYSGFVYSESETVLDTKPLASTSATVLSNAGTYPIELSPGTDNNYEITTNNGILTISKVTITVTADDQTKVYGEANPALTFLYSGWVNSDDADDLDTKPVVSTTVTELSAAGLYTDAITLAGGVDNNYDFTYIPADLNVTKATITITADDQTKVYGEANPALTFLYSGWMNNDDADDLDTKPVVSTTVTELSPAGLYTDAIALAGGVDNNYDFTYIPADLNVTKATITITADDQTKVYGETNPTLTFVYSGWVPGEDESVLDTKPVAATTVTVATGAGVYTDDITVAGGAAANYNFTYIPADFTVNKATLTVTANDKEKVYGSANPVLTFQYSGWVNSDNSEDLTTEPSASATVNELSPVGVYPGDITVSGGADENYSFSYVPANITVTKATLTATAENKTKVYGSANPELSISYTGFVNSDDITVIEIEPSIATTADLLSSVGSYPITLSGGMDNNYNITLADAALTVTKAPLTATPDNKSKTYGEENPALTLSYSGFLNGDDQDDLDTAPVPSTTVTTTSDAGTYPIILSAGTDNNYDIAAVDGTLTINKATISVTADDKTRVYGEANPEFTLAFSGFVLGDDQNDLDVIPVPTTIAAASSDAGIYDIEPEGGSDNNYEYEYIIGRLTVIKADQAITFTPIPSGLRATQNYEMIATSTSGLPVSFISTEPDIAIVSGDNLEIVKEGSLQIIASQEGNHNWNAATDEMQNVLTLPTYDNIRSLFTPNNDGMNDYWYIPYIEQYGNFSVQIYNRFGKLLYESSAYKNDWDGTYNGTPLPSASYYYLIKSDLKGIVKGVVNIVR